MLPANWPDRERAQRRLERFLAREAAQGAALPGGAAQAASHTELDPRGLPRAERPAPDSRSRAASRFREALEPLAAALADAIAEALAQRLQALARHEPGAWLTVPEAAQYARASRGAIYAAIRSGALRAHSTGRRLVIDPNDLDAWIRGLPTPAPEPIHAREVIPAPKAQATEREAP